MTLHTTPCGLKPFVALNPLFQKSRRNSPTPITIFGVSVTTKKSIGNGGKKKGLTQFRVFNLGNTSPVFVIGLVHSHFGEALVKAKKVLSIFANGDVKFTHVNISLVRRDLGLKKFVKWYLYFYLKKSSW
ncbi:hypothetical protein Fmac_006007 [Flemingia macrophylla]|uniref:Uncharacterized protein n=1 Tax=Flemingia macrophylla TaxID=520843 RepID=A0ABD1N9D5_9FABA